MRPVLSICIVVRDAAADLVRTLASLDRETSWLRRLPAEVVLVDGESSDDSFTVAQRWAERCGLPVRLLQQPPRGIYPAMNEAWRQALGEWLLYINAGDLLLDAAPLADALAAADASEQQSLQFEAAMFIPGSSRGLWMPGRTLDCHQALVYRRALHQLCGPYDERLSICADRLFMERIRTHGRRICPHLLSATQVSPANASRDPRRLSRDLTTARALGLPFISGSPPWLSLVVLRIERWIGISLTVWLRLWLLKWLGSARQVSLG